MAISPPTHLTVLRGGRSFGNAAHRQPVLRMGGEEFAIILPETDSQAGVQVAERLRSSVAASPLVQGGREVGITVSIGLNVRRDGGGLIDTDGKVDCCGLVKRQ